MTATFTLVPGLLDCNSAPGHLRTSRTNSSLSRNASMFNSLKHRLSRKGSTSKDNMHPYSSNTPSTRRPANLPSINNPFRDTGEAPPPYTAGSAPAEAAQLSSNAQPQPAAAQQDDDPYAFLASFDTIFLIDDSGSMAGSRWRETKEALEKITPICTTHDADGIDIFFLNTPDSAAHHNVSRVEQVNHIFNTVRPSGATPTGQRLNQILKPYLEKYKKNPETTKPINIICITDGEPSDDVESPLIQAAKKLDKCDAPAWQVGVQFFQVGHDERAKAHLKQLDDDLAEIAGDDDLRDIVDTVPFTGATGGKLTGDGILKVVLGAVNRRLDRKKSKDLHR